MRPSQLPVYKNQYGADGNFHTSVRQTRLGFKPASAFKRGDYALANLLYHPLPNLMYGVELQYGKRQNKGDGQTDTVSGEFIESFDDFRIQFSIKYTFGTRIGGES